LLFSNPAQGRQDLGCSLGRELLSNNGSHDGSC
jgi:hypothetical protein